MVMFKLDKNYNTIFIKSYSSSGSTALIFYELAHDRANSAIYQNIIY